MSSLHFESIDVVLGDHEDQHRIQSERILHEWGCQNVQIANDAMAVEDIIASGEIDLLIADMALPNGDLNTLIQQVRNGILGPNPFLTTITLISEPNETIVKQCMNSGADIVILKPFSTSQFMNHLTMAVEHSRQFVSTADYTGPFRREPKRTGAYDIPKINIPNQLQEKLENRFDPDKMKTQNIKTMDLINNQKMVHISHKIIWLIGKISQFYLEAPPDEKVIRYVEELFKITVDMNRRLKVMKNDRARELCSALKTVAENLQGKPLSPDHDDLEELSKLAYKCKSVSDWY